MQVEIYSNVPNPLVPMHFFKDVRGFVCLNIVAAVAGTVYLSLSIIWPSRKFAQRTTHDNINNGTDVV